MRTNAAALRVALLTALGLAGCGGESRGQVTGGAGGDGGSGPNGAGSGGGGTPGAGANAFPCRAPLASNGDPSGNTETCAGGLTHRKQAASCISRLPRPEPLMGAASDAPCTQDSDCTAMPNGYCTYGFLGGVMCAYGCLEDSECEPGYACQCGSNIGSCVPADCRTDADCAPGLLCTEFDASRGCGTFTFACQTPDDTCGGDDDCGPAGHSCSGGLAHGPRTCGEKSCVSGRPLVVDGAERLADPAARADWRTLAREACLSLEPHARRLAADAWTRAALAEHASIATFARFVLELSAFGAPPELLERAVRAQRDELGHARDAFELASRFAGRDVGPGPLAVDGCLTAASLASSVAATVLEGCAGETLATLEAEAALATCEDETARAALARVRREEAEHAELAFRFVAWALAGDASLASVVESALEGVVAREHARASLGPARSPHEPSLRRVGILPEAARCELRARGVDEVVVPCVRALLAAARANVSARAPRLGSRCAA